MKRIRYRGGILEFSIPGRLGGGGRGLEAAASAAKPGDPPPELLPNGNALRSYWRDGREVKTPVRVK